MRHDGRAVAQNPRRVLSNRRRGRGGANWLKGLDRDDRDAIGQDLMRVQFRWPVGMPLCRPMGEGLWEVRTNLADGRIARVLFCVVEGCIVVVHGFMKKSRKIPNDDLAVARRRKKEFE